VFGVGGAGVPPGMGDPATAMAQVERMMEDPEGRALMMEIQSNPAVMAAAMDIATNGENAALKYEDNAEVMNYLRKLEELMTK